uniref:T9SS type A sorting domain-containing protein n=1 Tax=candidate division WOR-3 bacterium TaxID=2052148 RepID=A0A7C3N9R1_UNCW3
MYEIRKKFEQIKGGKMKRILTVLLLVSIILLFVGAKSTTKDVVTTSLPTMDNGSVTNPLADGFKSVTKGKEMVKAMKDPNWVHLPYHDFDVRNGEPNIPSDLKAKLTKDGTNYYILKFSGPVLEKYKSELSNYDVKFEWPVHNYGYIVKMRDSDVEKISNLPYIKFISLWHPAYKASPKFLNSKSDSKREIVVRLFRNGSYYDVLETLNKMGAKILDRSEPTTALATFLVEVPENKIADIAKIKDVYLMMQYAKKYPRNDDGRAIIMNGTVTVGDTVIWKEGVRGEGQIINVTDSGITVGHYQFYDSSVPLTTWGYYPTHRKVIAYLPSAPSFIDTLDFGDDNNNSYHGTHTSCTAAGSDDGISTSNYDGIAKKAKIFFMDCGNNVDAFLWVPIDCYSMFDTMYVHGARITSNSYGPSVSSYPELAGAYDEGCQMTDAYMWDHKDFNVHFAAGNDGSAAQTISGTACAKDVYAAGSCSESSPVSVSSFSSRGPTADGRYGVTLLTPGETVMSADGSTSGSTSNYVSMQGTSMATPFSAGSIALIRDYLAQGFYPTGTKIAENAINNPSSALIRALAVNSANDCGQTIPNTNYGFGRLQLNNCLFFAVAGSTSPKAVLFDDNQDGLLTGEYVEYQFNVTNTANELRITLVWTDYPAPFFGDNTVTDTTLVNDLDLKVYNPSGTLVSGTDHLNTIEQYRNTTPTAGIWKVRVVATDCPVSPQPYAIVVSYSVYNVNNGSVKFDKAVYSVIDSLATISVTDLNLPDSSTFDINVYSKLGDTEQVTLTGTTGLFKGSVKMAYEAITSSHLNDGLLGVNKIDTIWAVYSDTDPVATLTAQALIDNATFTIYNVRCEKAEGTRGFIAWNTTEPTTGKVYYGPTTSLGYETAENPNLVYDHSGDQAIIVSNLTPNTVYYFDVESKDHKGNTVRDNNNGSHYQFATVDLSGADILVLVTDDNLEGELFAHPDFLVYAIQQGGWNYAWYQTSLNNFGQIPVDSLMRNYKAIFLQSGQENYPPLTKSQEESLKKYEAGGGRIAYTGHDFGWAMASKDGYSYVGTDKNDSLFVINYMMGRYVGDIVATGNFTLYGVTGDPISGSYTTGVSYNPYRSGADGDSMYGVSSAFVAGTSTNVWRWNAASGPVVGVKWESTNNLGTSGVGVWGGYKTRVIFNAFEITQIDTANATSTTRTTILNNNLIWLIGHDHPDVTISSPTTGSTYTTNTISITWTATAYGGASIDTTYLYYSPNGGDSWILITKGTSLTSPYSWDVSSLLNGNKYRVKVKVKDKNVYPAMTGEASTGNFTISRTGGDYLGPIIYAGSIQANSSPVGNATGLGLPTSFTIKAIVCDSTTGMSNISAAEWSYGPTAASAGTGNPMTAVDGAFDEMYEEVQATVSSTIGWPVGQIKIWVRGRDASPAKTPSNWGDAFEGSVIVVDATTTLTRVEMTEISAIADNNSITLKWSTTSELNNSKWVIERSTDGRNFENVGTLEAKNAPSTYTFTDTKVNGGTVYYYKVSDISKSGVKTEHPVIKVVASGKPKPTTFTLTQNQPNPFKDVTIIEYAVPVKGKVTLEVYDITGKLVKTLVNEVKEVSWYTAKWDGKDNSGKNVASGVYFYKLQASGYESMMKMTYLK